jgi:hypothetical protein
MADAQPALLVQLGNTEDLGIPPVKHVLKVLPPPLVLAAVPTVTVDNTRISPVSPAVRPVQQAMSVMITGRG